MEPWFKAAFGGVFLALVAAAVRVGRRLRRRPGASVDQRENELPLLRILRPVLGVVFYAALVDWLLPGARIPGATLELPPVLRGVGAVVAALSVALVAWSFEALGRQYRGGVGLWTDHELVTSGPYAYVRHPIYAGFVLAMVGIFLLSASWPAGLSGLLLTLSIPRLRIPVEEAELEERFGDRWRGYRDRTGALVPRLPILSRGGSGRDEDGRGR